MKEFVPFHRIHEFDEVLGVDCFHPRAFSLSHWKGATTPKYIEDDTSAGICLNALKQNIPQLSFSHVSSNHFDIDGFIGVWALTNPVLALHFEAVLREMALIGDFREYKENNPFSDLALKLVCWINAEERKHFYAPFESHTTEEKEGLACVEKFEFFNVNFEMVLLAPEKFKSIWEPEYQNVKQGISQMTNATIKNHKALRLRSIALESPIHYYALFSDSAAYDVIASCYSGNRYEVEYKYTTWVDCHLRKQFPRVDLTPLATQLNKMEEGGQTWMVDKITDTGPILRIQGPALSKYQRFLSPTERTILSSSINPELWLKTVTSFFGKAYEKLELAKAISWEETRKINAIQTQPLQGI